MVNGDDNNINKKPDQTDLSDEGASTPSDEEKSLQETSLVSDSTEVSDPT